MSAERAKVVATLHTALTDPVAVGGAILQTVVSHAKDGFVSVSLLQGLVRDLKGVPLAYLHHCLAHQDTRNLLEHDDVTDKVRVRPSRAEIDPDALVNTTEPTGTIVFDNGHFFADSDHAPTAPTYDQWLGKPYGAAVDDDIDREGMPTCWNCDAVGHTLLQCKKKRDDERIRANRARFREQNHDDDPRYYDTAHIDVSLLEPGRLSWNLINALEITAHQPYPPYYGRMRENGYPPGYYGTAQNQEVIMQLLQQTQPADDLKVYDEPPADEQDDKGSNKDDHAAQDQSNAKFHMVYYPGLFDQAHPVPQLIQWQHDHQQPQ